MLVLVANAGSSSLKLSVIDDHEATLEQRELPAVSAPGTMEALDAFLGSLPGVDAVGHRIVHGGPHLRSPVLLDERVRMQLEAAAEIAPLHVPVALQVLDVLRERLHLPHVLCFDTAFHSTLPAAASTYAVPAEWREHYGVQRYGFHGLSCAWALRRAAALMQRDAASLQLLVAHQGAGASITAIRDGRSVDTTMGFTPLEGLVMATRSGSLDPGAMLWLQAARGMSVGEMDRDLEHASGILGLSGTDDMRRLLALVETGDGRAMLARDVYVHRARALMAAMAASLQRIDAIVFTGGVGEHAAAIRELICEGLGVLGVEAPGGAADAVTDADVSGAGAKVRILVVHAREDLEVAREVRQVLAA